MIARTFAVALLVLAHGLSAQERVTTASGRTAILYPDGTWRYEGAGASAKADTAAAVRNRSANATARLDLSRVHAVLYYDPNKWTVTPSEDPGRTTLSHRNGDGYSAVITERLQITPEGLKQIALQNARNAAPDTRIVSEQHLRVNGTDVLCMQMAGTIQGIQFVYLGYYYAGPQGAIQILTYTASNLFDEYRADFQELLDGFTLTPP